MRTHTEFFIYFFFFTQGFLLLGIHVLYSNTFLIQFDTVGSRAEWRMAFSSVRQTRAAVTSHRFL